MTQLANINLDNYTPEQLQLLTAQILSKQQQILQARVEQLTENQARLEAKLSVKDQEIQTLQHRVNNVDVINHEGDLRQRVNRMISKYAFSQGITHRKSWIEFKGAMNMAYRMNIQARFDNYCARNGLDPKNVTMPDFLEANDLLEDAVRVLDKMINGQMSA